MSHIHTEGGLGCIHPAVVLVCLLLARLLLGRGFMRLALPHGTVLVLKALVETLAVARHVTDPDYTMDFRTTACILNVPGTACNCTAPSCMSGGCILL